MNGERFCRSQARRPIGRPCSIVRTVALRILTVAMIGIVGCSRNEPIQKSVPPPIETPAPQLLQPPLPPPESPVGQSLTAEPQLLEGSGVAVWGKGFPQLIAGLDGELYEPYNRQTIERVQKALGD